MSVTDWKDLENDIAAFLAADKATTTPGSGNTKEEEDVVGKTLICQCKNTGTKNISILSKDVARLLDAAELLDKFPLFINRSAVYTILSVTMIDKYNEELKSIIDLLIIMTKLKQLDTITEMDLNISEIEATITALNNIRRLYLNFGTDIRSKIDKLSNVLDSKLQNKISYNLFDNMEK